MPLASVPEGGCDGFVDDRGRVPARNAETVGHSAIYGISGDSLNALTDAIRRDAEFEWIHVRHEEVAAFAAGAEAHLTKDLTVCAGSCGPGNLHHHQWPLRLPSQPRPRVGDRRAHSDAELGTNFFQETHPELIFEECSDYCAVVSNPERLPRMLEIAMETSVARRGVSVLVIPGGVAFQKTKASVETIPVSPAPSYVRPSEQRIERMAHLIESARRVTILGGAGCTGAHAELLELARKVKAPIVIPYAARSSSNTTIPST